MIAWYIYLNGMFSRNLRNDQDNDWVNQEYWVKDNL